MVSRDDLKRWVDAGLIESDQAESISAFEANRRPQGQVGRGMEAVAYLGASLVLVALGILASEFWDRLQPWGQFGLSAIVTAVLFVVGLLLGRSDEPAVNRAQMFSWLLTVAGVAMTSYVAFARLLNFETQDTFLFVSLISFAAAAVLWLYRKSVLQVAAMGITAGIAVVSVIGEIDVVPDWVFGLALAALGTVWLLLTWGGVLEPVRTSYALGSIGVLLISVPGGDHMPWPLLGLLAGLALMAASVRLDQTVLLGLGVAGLFIYIPMTIFEAFGESLGVPVALLITGLVLLGVVIATIRLRRETQP
jgi:uncharacterized membrane protein